MRSLSRKSLRIAVLAALLLSTGYGLAQFSGTGIFFPFLLYSLPGVLATAAVLWFGDLEKLGTTETDLAIYLLLLAPSYHNWGRMSWIDTAFSVGSIAFVLLFIGITFLAASRNSKSKGSNPAAESEPSLTSKSSLPALLVSIFVYGQAADTVSENGLSLVWSFPFLLQPMLLIWIYVIYRIELKAINPTNNLSIAVRND